MHVRVQEGREGDFGDKSTFQQHTDPSAAMGLVLSLGMLETHEGV